MALDLFLLRVSPPPDRLPPGPNFHQASRALFSLTLTCQVQFQPRILPSQVIKDALPHIFILPTLGIEVLDPLARILLGQFSKNSPTREI